ncbi:MAG: hypothetical protein ACOC58_00500 [Chloroflexota bacterium]
MKKTSNVLAFGIWLVATAAAMRLGPVALVACGEAEPAAKPTPRAVAAQADGIALRGVTTFCVGLCGPSVWTRRVAEACAGESQMAGAGCKPFTRDAQ